MSPAALRAIADAADALATWTMYRLTCDHPVPSTRRRLTVMWPALSSSLTALFAAARETPASAASGRAT